MYQIMKITHIKPDFTVELQPITPANLEVWDVEQFYNKLVKSGEATIGFVVVELENGQPVKPHLLKDFVAYL